MRKTTAIALGLFVCGAAGPAQALTARDTMSAWESASSDERRQLLDQIGPDLSKHFAAERGAVLECMNHTAEAGPHAGLPIGEVAQACVSAAEEDDGTQASSRAFIEMAPRA